MRVLFMSPHSDPEADIGEPDSGGQCVYEHQLAIELVKLGINVDTFVRQTGKRPDVSKVTQGYTIYRIVTDGINFKPKEIIEADLTPFVQKVKQILDETNNDRGPMLVHGHYWDGGKAALMLKYNYIDVPFVWTPHSLGAVKRRRFDGFVNEMEYKFLPRIVWENYAAYVADRVIISSQEERLNLLQMYSIVRNSTDVIAPGLDLQQLTQSKAGFWRQKLKIGPTTTVLLCLGRMARSKGYHHAIKILHTLNTLRNERVVLVILGGSENQIGLEEKNYGRFLRDLTAQLGLEAQVYFHPAVPHERVGDIYAMADLFLMTSEREPFGLTTVEAMACGTPVVAHLLGGSSSLITNNETGFLSDMQDYSQTAGLIHSILKKPEQMKRVATAAAELMHAEFGWGSKAAAFLQVYKSVVLNNFKRLDALLTDNYFLQKNLHIPSNKEEFIRKN